MFEEIIETQIKAVSLIDGEWYVRLDGDLAGKVVGAVYDASAGDSDLVPVSLSVSYQKETCFQAHRLVCGPDRVGSWCIQLSGFTQALYPCTNAIGWHLA